MDSAVPILRRVGIALIVVGLLDIGVMIYCIVNQKAYSSSLSFFAVIAGVFLMRANLRAARLVSYASLFFLSAAVSLLLLWPSWIPPAYVMTLFRIAPLTFGVSLLLSAALLGFLWWTHAQLASPPVMTAMLDAGLKAPKRWRAALAGVALVLALSVLLHLSLNGETARAAIERAKREHGEDQRYFVSSLSTSESSGKRSVRATVTGFTARETRDYEVAWEE